MATLLQCHKPTSRPWDADRDEYARMCASLLLGGAIPFAIFCFLPMFFSLKLALMFLPGYLAMAGYAWRTDGPPTPFFCRAIWALSIVVQGSWLSWVLKDVLANPARLTAMIGLGIGWWAVSTAISVVGLLLEPNSTTPRRRY